MAAYATAAEVAAGFRELDEDEQSRATALLDEAAVLIDAEAPDAANDVKKIVSCRMVRRALGDGGEAVVSPPIGSTQGSMAAAGYSQSWTIGSGGSAGELFLSKIERKLLGLGNKIGARSPLEGCVRPFWWPGCGEGGGGT